MSQKTVRPYGGRPPHNETETSIEAAAHAASFQETMKDQVLALLKSYPPGLCDWQMEQILNAKHTTLSARRRELVLEGMVLDSGDRRETPSGCRAIVWRARGKDEQLSLDAPEQLDVIKSKLRKLIGKLETREQVDAVWAVAKRELAGGES